MPDTLYVCSIQLSLKKIKHCRCPPPKVSQPWLYTLYTPVPSRPGQFVYPEIVFCVWTSLKWVAASLSRLPLSHLRVKSSSAAQTHHGWIDEVTQQCQGRELESIILNRIYYLSFVCSFYCLKKGVLTFGFDAFIFRVLNSVKVYQ